MCFSVRSICDVPQEDEVQASSFRLVIPQAPLREPEVQAELF
jgi:hypothetical protein